MQAWRTTTRVWRARGDHYERTITRNDARGKLIRKINVREFFQMLACSLEHGFWIFLMRSALLRAGLRRKGISSGSSYRHDFAGLRSQAPSGLNAKVVP